MHIVLAALGAIVTILILVNRLSENGIDIGWLNPFAWKRRRDWAKKYHADPVYSISSPMEVTALLMVALAKSEGEVSAEQKQEIKHQFQEVFRLSEDQAAALLGSSAFILKDDISAVRDMNKLLAPSMDAFSQERAESAYKLLAHIASFESAPNQFQTEVLSSFRKCFQNRLATAEEWV